MSDELDIVPPATPAAPDLICWLHAAFPARADGRLDTTRIAAGLGLAPGTVRRWVRDAKDLELNDTGMRLVIRRAILRGRGTYLWPALDPSTAFRQQRGALEAQAGLDLLENRPDLVPESWTRRGLLEPHTVSVVHYPRAHVYGVVGSRTRSHINRVAAYAELVETTTHPTKLHADAAKFGILLAQDDHRCIAPRALVPTGRTETWREKRP